MQAPSLSFPANDNESVSGKLHFPIVGLGASAGGLQALTHFFERMPAGNGMAFVVILHLSPAHQSNAAGVLQMATAIPVRQVAERTAIEKDHIYVIPPNKQLSMDDGFLQVSDSHKIAGKPVVIDLFLRTLADAHKERAVGIVLSGTGTDGTVGLARIKEQGGITFAQDPKEAEYDGMPVSAIGSGMVDVVLPAAEMPQKLTPSYGITCRRCNCCR